jgi:hypothetical protein
VRALEDIVDDICCCLRSDPEVRQHVLVQIEFVKEIAKRPPRVLDSQMRARRKKARAAVAFIREVSGDMFVPPWLHRMADARRPDPRFDHLQWWCGHAACMILELYGNKPVGGTQRGDLPAVTQLIYEAVTGEAPSKDASGLHAARSMLAWRKPIST